MSTSEYMGWIAYLDSKSEELEKPRNPKDVVGMSENDMVHTLTGSAGK